MFSEGLQNVFYSKLSSLFQLSTFRMIDQSQGSSCSTEVQKIKDAIQSIPNLSKEDMLELHTAEIKARHIFGPLLHYTFWKTVGNLISWT